MTGRRDDILPVSPGKSLMERVEDALLPLINVVFLLLMFFIVAGQMSDQAMPELPGVTAEESVAPPTPDLIIQPSGQLIVDGQRLGRDQLLRHLPPASAQKPLVIAAAASTSMPELESLFNTLAEAGYAETLLLTEPSE